MSQFVHVFRYGEPNLLTVAVNNTLTSSSIPQGSWQWKQGTQGPHVRSTKTLIFRTPSPFANPRNLPIADVIRV